MDDLFSVISGMGNQRMEDIGISAFIFVISASLVSAFAISSLYTYFFTARATGSQVHRLFHFFPFL